jgi:pyruvate ferredoxin oxidoreductase gamma subunit
LLISIENGMFQVRFHGRGGQGAVTGAELLSVAAFAEGKYAQAFPSFGSERMGAPVASFCRIAEGPIRGRGPVVAPDAVLVQDPTLLHVVEVFQGLRDDGWVIVNTGKDVGTLGIGDIADRLPPGHVRAVAATEIATAIVGKPVPNVPLLGALAALTRVVSLPAIQAAIRGRFAPRLAEANVEACTRAYTAVKGPDAC